MRMNSKKLALNVRKDVLEMIHRSHASHIGAAYSVADILAVLYADIMNYDAANPKWKDRDRLVLSKGHAGSALYATLAEVGYFDKSVLDTYDLDGSPLSGHISHKGVPGVEFSTGSLGHGVCVATGLALALKIDGSSSHVYAITGDGECDEGSFWETIMFANQYNLSNFTIVIDRNGMQAMGDVKDVMDTGDLGRKIKEFGWNVIDVDGHDHDALRDAFLTKFNNGKPTCVVAKTTKGKGVSFFENSLLWHYRDPQGEAYENAKKELEGLDDEK